MKAHPLRGKNWDEVARAFQERFPIGSILTVDEFDEWAIYMGLLEEPRTREKGSAEWDFFVSKRDVLKKNIHQASTHPRMFEDGDTDMRCYEVVINALGTWRVISVEMAIAEHHFADASISAFETKRKRVKHYVQGMNPNAVARHIYRECQSIDDDYDAIYERFLVDAKHLNAKADRLMIDIKAEEETEPQLPLPLPEPEAFPAPSEDVPQTTPEEPPIS